MKGQAGRGLTFADLRTKRNVLGGSTLYFLLGRHVEGLSRWICAEMTEAVIEEKQLEGRPSMRKFSVMCRGSVSF